MVRRATKTNFGARQFQRHSYRVCARRRSHHRGLCRARHHSYFMERKVCAYFQCRIGPVRVGWWGTLQVFADVLKMLIKEIFTVDKADKLLYYLAPFLVIAASIGTFSFLPWNKGAAVLDFNVGIFLVTAISSIGVLGVFYRWLGK